MLNIYIIYGWGGVQGNGEGYRAMGRGRERWGGL